MGSGPTSSGSQTINQDGFEAQQKVFQQQERQQSKAEEKRKVEPVRVWTLNGEEEEDNEESQGIWREALLVRTVILQNIQAAVARTYRQHRPQVVSRCHLKKNPPAPTAIIVILLPNFPDRQPSSCKTSVAPSFAASMLYVSTTSEKRCRCPVSPHQKLLFPQTLLNRLGRVALG